MSDPFHEINDELLLDKAKALFKRYRAYIAITLIFIIVFPLAIGTIKYNKDKKEEKISGYYIEILNLIAEDESKALLELDKLSKLKHSGVNALGQIISLKINLKNKDFSKVEFNIENLEENYEKTPNLQKLIDYYIAQSYLEMNNKSKLEKKVNNLLKHGGVWALLGLEVRGHYYYQIGDYDNALKNFNKIVNEQVSTNSIRSRATEMINNIYLFYENQS